MVDDLDRDLAGLGFVEWITLGRVERRPRGFVNLGAECAFEFFVRLVCAGEVRVADEEAFAVVVRVNEPARDVIGRTGANLPRRRLVHVHAFDSDDEFVVLLLFDLNIRFTENHK